MRNFALVHVGAFIKVESSRKRQGIALEISHFVRYLGLVEHFCLVVASLQHYLRPELISGQTDLQFVENDFKYEFFFFCADS